MNEVMTTAELVVLSPPSLDRQSESKSYLTDIKEYAVARRQPEEARGHNAAPRNYASSISPQCASAKRWVAPQLPHFPRSSQNIDGEHFAHPPAAAFPSR